MLPFQPYFFLNFIKNDNPLTQGRNICHFRLVLFVGTGGKKNKNGKTSFLAWPSVKPLGIYTKANAR